MTLEGNLIPVIKSGTSHRSVVETKSRHSNDMQICSGGGTKTSNIARILWDFGFDESNMKHRLSVMSRKSSSLNLWI